MAGLAVIFHRIAPRMSGQILHALQGWCRYHFCNRQWWWLLKACWHVSNGARDGVHRQRQAPLSPLARNDPWDLLANNNRSRSEELTTTAASTHDPTYRSTNESDNNEADEVIISLPISPGRLSLTVQITKKGDGGAIIMSVKSVRHFSNLSIQFISKMALVILLLVYRNGKWNKYK